MASQDEKVLERLTYALEELRAAVNRISPGTERSIVQADLLKRPVAPAAFDRRVAALNLERAETAIARVLSSQALNEQQKLDFKRIADDTLNERLRLLARGEEVATTINVTVTGTGTISVD